MKDDADLANIIKEIELHGMHSWLIEKFADSFDKARLHKTRTFNEHSYDERWLYNIPKLVDSILGRYYHPSSSISFIIFDPMVREIFAAPFIDRIVHHFLYEMQGGWWDHHFITDSYSCRDGKGTLYGVNRVRKLARRATQNYTKPAHIIKLDIRGYFMSLPRRKLYERIEWGIDQQFKPYLNNPAGFELYQICKYLWYQILLDNPVARSHRRGSAEHWNKLPNEKSLYFQPYDQGIVIGNLTSQLVSNIYLDQLDRYIKFELGYKYYCRYVDDFLIIVSDEEYEKAKKDVRKIENYLKNELKLTLHPKKRFYGDIYKGFTFLGYRIYPHCAYPSDRLQSRLKTNLYNVKYQNTNPAKLISYFGLVSHMDVNNYIKDLFAKYNVDYNLYLEMKSNNHRSFLEIIEDIKKGSSREKGKRPKR